MSDSPDLKSRLKRHIQPNHSIFIELARDVTEELVGGERMTCQGPALTASEDFACFLEGVPA